MASTPASNTNDNNSNSTSSSSYFQKTVCLQDWWLIKAEKDFEGKTLAVAGLTSRQLQAVRVFSSAPILKRYDVFTLETVDGVCVLIKGFINKVRTEENGFPSEVFKHFVFGFPPYWEKYAEKCLGGGFSNEDVSRSTLGRDKLSTDSGVDDFHERRPNRNKKVISKQASTSRKKTKRKLIYESPVTQGGIEKTSSVSPESLSFKRSRSGRLLLPSLEFWRNQMAIYDAVCDHFWAYDMFLSLAFLALEWMQLYFMHAHKLPTPPLVQAHQQLCVCAHLKLCLAAKCECEGC